MTTILILGWIACGVLAYGIGFAYCEREYAKDDKTHVLDWKTHLIILIIFGPIFLASALTETGFAKHGLKFW